MDPVSHYVISWAVGRRLHLDNGAFRVFLFFSVLPDIDVLSVFFGLDALLRFHGTVTHSILFILSSASLAFFISRRKSFFVVAFAGGFLHLLVDVIVNTSMFFTGGCRCFWPLSDVRCLLVYHLPIPVLVFRIVYYIIFLVSYSTLAYLIYKRQYPWTVWLKS